jgi:glutathione synthase/RimK-type ligase-like ATP-grasp enzyme
MKNPIYRLAVLYNYKDPLSPSNIDFLLKLQQIGRDDLNVEVDIIEEKDYHRLTTYDALFLRDTTYTHHYTYDFARRAEAENMPVIDDTESILKCNNKLYMMELLRHHHIPRPRSEILTVENIHTISSRIPFPIVIKVPSASFSKGVFKAEDMNELRDRTKLLFDKSPLLLAQEYIYTNFDWRIGILNNAPLFACKYYMSKGHWQIYKHETNGRFFDGDSETIPIEEVPAGVIEMALKATKLIGNGLYGVDIKEIKNGLYLMEVNDSPNIEAGTEDTILGDEIYRTIIKEFMHRSGVI